MLDCGLTHVSAIRYANMISKVFAPIYLQIAVIRDLIILYPYQHLIKLLIFCQFNAYVTGYSDSLHIHLLFFKIYFVAALMGSFLFFCLRIHHCIPVILLLSFLVLGDCIFTSEPSIWSFFTSSISLLYIF